MGKYDVSNLQKNLKFKILKICFIDSWTSGIENFAPIHDTLMEKGINSFLIHTRSFDGDNEEKIEEVIRNVVCRDIKFYKTRFIYKALQIEKPDVVLNLTSFYILDRAINYACKALGIKTVFLTPGTRELDINYIKNVEYRERFKPINKKRFAKINKYFFYVFPNYFFSIIKYNFFYLFHPRVLRAIMELAINPAKKIMYPTPSEEIHADKALVFSNGYKEFFQNMYGYPSEKVFCVGNPKLDNVFKILEKPIQKVQTAKFYKSYNIPHDKNLVTFLASPFVESGYKGWTSKFRIEEYKKILQVCKKQNCHLVIKLHHASFNDPLLGSEFKKSEDITIIKGIDSPTLISLSDAVLGHSSSTLFIPIIFRKPLIIIKWESCNFVNDRFANYNVTRVSKNHKDLINLLKNINTIGKEMKNNDLFKNFIDKFIHYEDSKSMERIVKHLIELEKK